jgi:hypothetical protein
MSIKAGTCESSCDMSLRRAACVEAVLPGDGRAILVDDHLALGKCPLQIEIEIVYNNTRINRLLSMGPPCFAIPRLIWHRLDREPLIPTSPLAIVIASKTYT